MTITELNQEFQKAFEDMIMFGTGAITIEQGEIKHVPFEGLNDNQTATDNPTSQHDFEGISDTSI